MPTTLTASLYNDLMINAHTALVEGGASQSQLYNGVPTLKYLTKVKGLVASLDGGAEIAVNYRKTAQSTNAWKGAGLQSLTILEEETEARGVFDWAYMWEPLTVSQTTMDLIAGENRVKDKVQEDLDFVIDNMKDNLNTAIHTTQSNGPLSLVDIVNTGNTIGTINRANNTWFDAQTGSGPSGQLFNIMLTLYNNCGKNILFPEFILTSQAQNEAFIQTHFGKISYNDPVGVEMGSGPNSVPIFMGADIVWDNACPATKMYFLNSKALRLYVHEKHNFAMSGPIEIPDKTGWIYKFSHWTALIPLKPRHLGVLTVT